MESAEFGVPISIKLEYYAALRDCAGKAAEDMTTSSITAGALYGILRERYRFPFTSVQVRVAVNGAFVEGAHMLKQGDHVVFVPPVSGG